MTKTAILAAFALAVSILIIGAGKADAANSTYEQRVIRAINDVRDNRGLRPVIAGPAVDGVSERWVRYMRRTGEYHHRNQYAVLRMLQARWVGEVLLRTKPHIRLTPRATVRAWMASPTHRAVLVSPRAERAGVAFSRDRHGRLYGAVNLVEY